MLPSKCALSGNDGWQTLCEWSGALHTRYLADPGKTGYTGKSVADVHRVGCFGGTGATQWRKTHKTQEDLAQQYQTKLALNEQQQSMKRKIKATERVSGRYVISVERGTWGYKHAENKRSYLEERPRRVTREARQESGWEVHRWDKRYLHGALNAGHWGNIPKPRCAGKVQKQRRESWWTCIWCKIAT